MESITCSFGSEYCPNIQGDSFVLFCKRCCVDGNKVNVMPASDHELAELQVVPKALWDPEVVSFPRPVQDSFTAECWSKARVIGDGTIFPPGVWRIDAFGNVILSRRIAAISKANTNQTYGNFSWTRHHRIARCKGGPTLPSNLWPAQGCTNFAIGDFFFEVGTQFVCGESVLSLANKIFHLRLAPSTILGPGYNNISWDVAKHDGVPMLGPAALEILKCSATSKETAKLLLGLKGFTNMSGGMLQTNSSSESFIRLHEDINSYIKLILGNWQKSGRNQGACEAFDTDDMLPQNENQQPVPPPTKKKRFGNRRKLIGLPAVNILTSTRDDRAPPSDNVLSDNAQAASLVDVRSDAKKLFDCASEIEARHKAAAEKAHGTSKESSTHTSWLISQLAHQSAKENHIHVTSSDSAQRACHGCGSSKFSHVFVNQNDDCGLALRHRMTYLDTFDSNNSIVRHIIFSADTLDALSDDQRKEVAGGFSAKLLTKADFEAGKYDTFAGQEHRSDQIMAGTSVVNVLTDLSNLYSSFATRSGHDLQLKVRSYQTLVMIQLLSNSFAVPEVFGCATEIYAPSKLKDVLYSMKDVKSIFDLLMWFPVWRTIDMPIRQLRFAKASAIKNASMLSFSELVCLLGQAGQDGSKRARILHEIEKFSSDFSPAWCGTPGLNDALPFSDIVLMKKLYSYLALPWRDADKEIMMNHGFLPITFAATHDKEVATLAFDAAKKQLPVFSPSTYKSLEESLMSSYSALQLHSVGFSKYILHAIDATFASSWGRETEPGHFPPSHVPILPVGGILCCIDENSSFLESSFLRSYHSIALKLPGNKQFVFYHGVLGSVLPYLGHSNTPNCALVVCGIESNTAAATSALGSGSGYIQVVLCMKKRIFPGDKLTINRNGGLLHNIWNHLGGRHLDPSNPISSCSAFQRDSGISPASGTASGTAPTMPPSQSAHHLGRAHVGVSNTSSPGTTNQESVRRSGRESSGCNGVTPLETTVKGVVADCLKDVTLAGPEVFQILFLWGSSEPGFKAAVESQMKEILHEKVSKHWNIEFWLRPPVRSSLGSALKKLCERIDASHVVFIWTDPEDIVKCLDMADKVETLKSIYAGGRAHKVFPKQELYEQMEGKSGYMLQLQKANIPVKDFFVLDESKSLTAEEFANKTGGWQGVVTKVGFSSNKCGVDFNRTPVGAWSQKDYVDWENHVFSKFHKSFSSGFPLIVQQLDMGLDPTNQSGLEFRLYFVNSTFILARATSWTDAAHSSNHTPRPSELELAKTVIRNLGDDFCKSYSLVRIDLGCCDGIYFVNEVQVSSPSVEKIMGTSKSIPDLIAKAVAAKYVSLMYKVYVEWSTVTCQ